jgi:hypothetical protein
MVIVDEHSVGCTQRVISQKPPRDVLQGFPGDARSQRHLRDAHVRASGQQGREEGRIQSVHARRVRSQRCELTRESALPVDIDKHVFNADLGHVGFDGAAELANALWDLECIAAAKREAIGFDGDKAIVPSPPISLSAASSNSVRSSSRACSACGESCMAM